MVPNFCFLVNPRRLRNLERTSQHLIQFQTLIVKLKHTVLLPSLSKGSLAVDAGSILTIGEVAVRRQDIVTGTRLSGLELLPSFLHLTTDTILAQQPLSSDMGLT